MQKLCDKRRLPLDDNQELNILNSQIGEKLKVYAESGPVSRSEYTGDLSGKSIRIITENGPVFEYSFRD